MIDILNELLDLSNKITDKPCVGFTLERFQDQLEPTLVFRADWNNNFHFRTQFSITKVTAQPDDIMKIITYQANREYSRAK